VDPDGDPAAPPEPSPTSRVLRLYGQPADAEPLAWTWVDEQLGSAGTYWVVARGPGHPHPRPVWGVWWRGSLHLSVGSPVLARHLAADPVVTVHLDSGTDVVVVEGRAVGPASDVDLLAAYDRKYDWRYDPEHYGPLTQVEPTTVLAWRSAGRAGRDGFRQAGRWDLS
jgi:hypothetical protein